ncbi:hypothetical protein N7497_011334 [Penicillium chrysogenum]|nr:hypothetical protein N7497_011334 [Penicillium chrysogenum]
MPPQEAEVLSALKLLRDTPSDILNTHRDLALRTLTQIGRAINAHWIEDEAPDRVNVGVLGGRHRDATVLEAQHPQSDTFSVSSTPSQESDASSLPGHELSMSSSRTSLESTTRKRKRQATKDLPSVALIGAAKKSLPRILEFCKSNASLSEILQTEQEMQFADKRIDHLKQIDGNKTPSEEQKVLKGLSQLSLAQQFTDWETAQGWKPRADILYDGFGALPPKTAGKMTRFAREHGYPEPDHNVVRKGIQRGTNQLLFLKLLNDNSTSADQKDAVSGILALVTTFEYSLFQALSVSELPTLAKSLLQEFDSSEVIIDSQSDQRNVVLVSARYISQWFKNLSGDFEIISQMRRRHTHSLAHLTSSQTADGPVGSACARPVDSQSEADGEPDTTSNCQPSDVGYPSMNSHELTTFSTFPRAEQNPQRSQTNPSFMQLQQIPEEVEIMPNPRSHDLAQFSRNITDVGYPSMNSHELTTFSTFPRAEPNPQRSQTNPSFMQLQQIPEEVEIMPNPRSYDLAQFSRNITDVNCSLTSDSEPCSMSHSNIPIQQHQFVPRSCSAFPGDVRHPLSELRTTQNMASQELSSFSTIPA